MQRSLVGSEMCIRDRTMAAAPELRSCQQLPWHVTSSSSSGMLHTMGRSVHCCKLKDQKSRHCVDHFTSGLKWGTARDRGCARIEERTDGMAASASAMFLGRSSPRGHFWVLTTVLQTSPSHYPTWWSNLLLVLALYRADTGYGGLSSAGSVMLSLASSSHLISSQGDRSCIG